MMWRALRYLSIFEARWKHDEWYQLWFLGTVATVFVLILGLCSKATPVSTFHVFTGCLLSMIGLRQLFGPMDESGINWKQTRESLYAKRI